MDFKQYLISLDWNTFEQYPEQGSSIYIHCTADDDSSVHRFVKIRSFNAVTFDFSKITKDTKPRRKWRFHWLPITSINEEYVDFID